MPRSLAVLGLGLTTLGIALIDFAWRRRAGARTHAF